jgi:hypothetical protein
MVLNFKKFWHDLIHTHDCIYYLYRSFQHACVAAMGQVCSLAMLFPNRS